MFLILQSIFVLSNDKIEKGVKEHIKEEENIKNGKITLNEFIKAVINADPMFMFVSIRSYVR
ncbi:hypothetical protein [Caldicellulosiruptor changbaiensis]|uniref:hypothetical protein n=1 Tax=Caldicellulosiruptor changbaiensis TaxID=1222016 RepID=UPI001F49921A|nr:hypothetical protein [Caldicellulosiruptor changbaiensis]